MSPRPAGSSRRSGARPPMTSRVPPPRRQAAQPAWAATNYQERARIIRRAADIYEANRDEFGTWTQRETGASHSKMHHESNFAYQRDPQRGDPAVAAVRLAHAVGGQGPAVDGPPGPGRGHRRDHAVELAVGARDARRRAGAGARQRRRPQARSADAGRRRRDVRGGLPRGRPARGSAPGRRRRRRRRRGARDRPEHPGRVVHRLDGRRAAGRPAGRRACSRRSRSSSAATTRSSSSTTRISTPPPRPVRSRRSSSRARSASRPGATSSSAERRRRLHRRPEREGEAPAHGRPVSRGRPARADRQREAAPPRRRHRPALGRGRGAARARAARTRGCSTGRRCSPTVTPDMPAWTDEIFGPVAPITASGLTRRRSPSPTPAGTASSASVYTRSISRGLAVADRMRTGMVHVNDGTLNDEAIIPFGGMGMSGNGGRYGGEASLDNVHRVAVGDGARRPADIPVLMDRCIDRRGRELAGVSTATASRVVSAPTTRSARRPGRASSMRRGRSTTYRTRSPAGC